MLAVAWGCRRFHHYLYGRKFVCQTNHKALEAIHLKHLSNGPPRLLHHYQVYSRSESPVADAMIKVSPSDKTEIKGL